MTTLVQALMSWAHARRVLVLGLATVLAVACVLPLSRLRFDADVLHLMPRQGGAVEAFETYLASFGSLDALYLFIEAPEGYGIDDYREVIETLTARVRALPEVARVDAGPLDAEKDWSYVTDRQLLLLDDEVLADALGRLQPARVGPLVAASRDLLTLASPDVKALVQRDPLGWFDLLRPSLGGANTVLRVDASRTDGYVTPDGRAQLLLVHPTEPPFDTAFARRLIDAVHGARDAALAETAGTLALDELPAPRIEIAGGHRTAIETEALVRSEAISNTALSSIGILGVLYLAFRNVWVVVFGGMPILLATMVTLGLHQIMGVELSAAATGSSAMLFGLGDDGLVLLFVAYREALARGLQPREAVATLGGTGVSILLGAVTTTATFVGLWFMSFPSLQQLGLIVGIGILLTAFFTLTVLVAGLPGRAWATQARDLTLPGLARGVRRWRVPILVLSAIVTLPLAAGWRWISVDPTLERLRPQGEGLAVEQEISTRFGLARDVYLVVDRAESLEPLLARSEALEAELEGVADLRIAGPTTLLPTAEAQARRARALDAARSTVPATLVALDAAADEQGFVPGTFAPFQARLGTVLDPTARLTREGYETRGLGDLVGRFIADGPDRRLVAVSYATPDSDAALRALEAAVARQPTMALTGVPVVNRSLAARLPRELTVALAVGAVVVLLLIWMEFRRLAPTLYALVPTALGLIWGVGALGWAGIVLDLFSVFAILMFLGIGVDYGIHLVHPTLGAHGMSAERATALVGPAMLLAGITTLVGFGTLIRSEYVPLHSLGVASFATIGMSLVAGLFTLPALLMARRPGP